ncbi:hypothetical protein BaRGS_00030909 [Batillaria attramentaria]|uniref:Uncharacterized protein n=1 Tax=Batillaria attramentaria TaxID=370345 RepID=A0ABD0JRU6_9CAEN
METNLPLCEVEQRAKNGAKPSRDIVKSIVSLEDTHETPVTPDIDQIQTSQSCDESGAKPVLSAENRDNLAGESEKETKVTSGAGEEQGDFVDKLVLSQDDQASSLGITTEENPAQGKTKIIPTCDATSLNIQRGGMETIDSEGQEKTPGDLSPTRMMRMDSAPAGPRAKAEGADEEILLL